MCAKNHLLIFSSFLDILENVEWPRFFWTTRYISCLSVSASSRLQAQYMFMRHCLDGTVPRCLVAHCTPVSDCLKTSSAFCCQSSVCCAVLLFEFVRTSDFLCRRPDDVELTTNTSAFTPSLSVDGYYDHVSFQCTTNIDRALGTILALMRYINCVLLTYLAAR